MNSWDIFETLGEVEEELLLTSKPCGFHWGKGGLRILLIAAVICLLVGTALAVGLGARVSYGRQTVSLQGVSLSRPDDGSQSLSYHTAQVQYDLHTVEIKNAALFTEALTDAWAVSSGKTLYDLKKADGSAQNLGTIAATEALLGISLMESAELSALIRGIYVTMVIADPQRAAADYAQEGQICPDGLILYLSLRRGAASENALDARLVSECGITIFVPLTESFVRTQQVQTLYSHERQGGFTESGLMTQAGKSLLLLENSSSELGQAGYAVWCDGGLGYLAHLKTYSNGYATPLSLLAPLLGRIY